MQTSPLSPPTSSSALAPQSTTADSGRLEQQVRRLGDWFHNIDLLGVPTAPKHFLGDFPNVKWKHIAPAIPQDLSGAEVLDIGCNGGFYSLEMKRRGAKRVLGIDVDDRYLKQAHFAAETLGLEIELEKRSVYEVENIAGQFDFVFFMGVYYHLRYPLFALDQVVKKVRPEGRLIFQSMLRGSEEVKPWQDDYLFWETKMFSDPAYPAMYFVERSYANDQTNWWIPNRAAAEAVLRSAGLEILDHPESETWICTPRDAMRDGEYIIDLERKGTL
jgi:tRNA (mo5U34)-methyltransferase